MTILFTKQLPRIEIVVANLRVFSNSACSQFTPSVASSKWKADPSSVTATTTTTTTSSSSSPHNHPPYKRFDKLKKLSRKEEAEQYRIASRNRLQHLDLKYSIVTASTKKILDIGFAPGHWLSYLVDRVCQLHEVEDTKLHTVGVHILGFDILFKNPPLGTSSIQGNIFSKLSHDNVIQHFSEIPSKQSQLQLQVGVNEEIDHKSYFAQEIDESQLTKSLGQLAISEKTESASKESAGNWKVDLVISDLARPGRQQSGFYDYTETNPYLRYNNNKGLNHSIVNPKKGNLDLADGAILLMLKVLRPGGKFILKLTDIDNDDEEIRSMKKSLSVIFKEVHEINLIRDCIFICLDKQ
ncbi:hypothetical protein CANMA_002615 [Candida margitis]|uniref:uncharacterized protein n=1 Tax=Candida margitis TaxID=1775924 RepID=UPI00222696C6|nr:uncharacterized protein CANMA_002615 [Candida margitis]KAI5968113.1 hypothetical protein CANMA_002615 [Candida margitis]